MAASGLLNIVCFYVEHFIKERSTAITNRHGERVEMRKENDKRRKKIGGLWLQTGVTQQLEERQLQNKDNVDNKVVIY